MQPAEFLKVLSKVDDDFFIWSGCIRTRTRNNSMDSVDPIVSVARHEGYKGNDITEAIMFLELDLTFAMKVIEIVDGAGVYTPTDLKLKAKILNRTVNRKSSYNYWDGK